MVVNYLIHFLPDNNLNNIKSMSYIIKVKVIFCYVQKSLYCGKMMGSVGLILNERSRRQHS